MLQVGDQTFAKGFNEAHWNAAARRGRLPEIAPPRRTAPTRAPTTETASAATAAPLPSESRSVNAPASYRA